MKNAAAILCAVAAVLLLTACAGGGSGGDPPATAMTPAADDTGTYYAGLAGLSGAALRDGLQDLLEADHRKLTYAEVWDALQDTDQDPANPSHVILFYTGRSHDKADRDGQPGCDNDSWNREHIWPRSYGLGDESDYGFTDLHHLRPTDKSVNSSRGNRVFDNGGTPQGEAPDTYSDSDSWEPRDAIKGDTARMIFYMDVRYDGSDGGMADLHLLDDAGAVSGEPAMGVLCTLVAWHGEDPVDAAERTRNDRIQAWQGNRNPFIDHPEWVGKLYGAACAR